MQLPRSGLLARLGTTGGALYHLYSQPNSIGGLSSHLPRAVLDATAGAAPSLFAAPPPPPKTALTSPPVLFQAQPNALLPLRPLATPVTATAACSSCLFGPASLAAVPGPSHQPQRCQRASSPPRVPASTARLRLRQRRREAIPTIPSIFYAGDGSSSPVPHEKPPSELFPEGRPSPEHLNHIAMRISDWLPNFFKGTPDMTFYREDVIFDNRILGYQSRGVYPAWIHMMAAAWWGALRCAHIKMRLLSVTPKLSEGTVEAHWRVEYISLIASIGKYRKVVLQGEPPEKYCRWKEGISTFHADDHGRVYLHVAEDKVSDSPPPKLSLRERLLRGFAARKPVAPSPC